MPEHTKTYLIHGVLHSKDREATAAFTVRDNVCYVTLTIVHPKDQFVKARGRALATERLEAFLANPELEDNQTYFKFGVDGMIGNMSYVLKMFTTDSVLYHEMHNLQFTSFTTRALIDNVRYRLGLAPRHHYKFS